MKSQYIREDQQLKNTFSDILNLPIITVCITLDEVDVNY